MARESAKCVALRTHGVFPADRLSTTEQRTLPQRFSPALPILPITLAFLQRSDELSWAARGRGEMPERVVLLRDSRRSPFHLDENDRPTIQSRRFRCIFR